MKTMLKRVGMLFMAVSLILSSAALPAFAAEGDAPAAAEKVPAFPGAEGGGMWATGARGAEKPEIYHVTNLNDSGEGSFRDAVSQGNRIVVFDVSGYIDLSSNVNISHDNMTVLGQTAPGDGICFRSNNIKVGGNNIILRHLRFRVGSKLPDGKDTRAQDGLEIPDNGSNIIIDHCSVSWGTDENLSAYAIKDVTVQYSIIAEALNQSVHDKGEHGYGGIWGGINLSVHHNLIASHKSRNPKVGTSESVAMTPGYVDSDTLVDMKNNIIYNWGDKAGYGTENGAKTYIQNNIYRPGPATPRGKRARIFELSVGQKYQKDMLGSVYAVGNRIDVDEGDSDYKNAQTVNENNWQDDLHIGVYVDEKFYDTADKSNMVITEPNEQYKEYERDYPVTLDATEEVYEKVLNNAGATLPKRDKVDERVIDEVRTRTAPDGSKGSGGLLDDPLDGVPEGAAEGEYDERGYPVFSDEARPADYDGDGDGIADSWEDAMGLDKTNKTDSLALGPDGYTWLEIFVEESIGDGEDPAPLVLAAEDKYHTTGDTVKVSAVGGSTPTQNSYVTSYENGVVTVDSSASYDKAVAVAASYDSNGVLIESKSADVDKASGTASVGIVAEGASTKVFLWEDLKSAKPLCEAYVAGGGSGGDGITGVDFYCGNKLIAKGENSDGTWTANLTGLPAGNNSITAKAALSDGSVRLSPIKTVYVIGAEEAEGWTAKGEASFDGENYTLGAGSSLTKNVSGDFKLVGRIDEMSGLPAGTNTGLTVNSGGKTISLGKRYNENYDQVIYYGEAESQKTVVPAPADPVSGTPGLDTRDYVLFEISRAGDAVSLYAGTSLADLETAPLAVINGAGGDAAIGAEAAGAVTSVSKLSMLKLIETATNPKVEITNIKDNDRIDIVGSELKLNLTSDGDTPITEIWVYLDGAPLANMDVNIIGTQEVTIPLEFTGPTKGALSVYCFDDNLGRGEQTVNISVSQDGSPWLLADVGYEPGQAQTFADVSDDFTFKLYNSSTGNIGGTSDSFGYMYQQFSGDNRIYYRSRLSSGSQLGLVIKTDLDADGVTYFYGGTVGGDGKIDYQIMKRTTKGGNMELVEDVTDVIGEGSGQMVIAEKIGSKLNLYQSENNPTVYKTKKLIASIDIPEIGDSYYLGFGFVRYDPAAFIPDVGWVATEKITDATNSNLTWDFDYGLDWLWQMQEKNVLRPSWTKDMSGNSTGIMAIEPTNDYSGDRYIFREYIPEEGKVPNMSTDVLLAGDEPGFNIYFQVGDVDKAYKVTFSDDGKIYTNGTVEAGDWDTAAGWYNVAINTDIDETGAYSANLTVKQGDTVVVDGAPIELSTGAQFRTQKNTEKKSNDVLNAVYFEPISTASGKYYVDNVKVTQTTGSYTVEREANWYTFKNVNELTGPFTVDGTTLPDGDELTGTQMSVAGGAGNLATKGYDVAGVHFAKRVRLNKNKAGMMTVPVKSGSIIRVYCGSANSGALRSMFIDGTEYKVQASTALEHKYTGEDGTVEIYAGDGIDVYGVCVEKVTVTPKN